MWFKILIVALVLSVLLSIKDACPVASGRCPDDFIRFYLYTRDTGLNSPVRVYDKDSASVRRAPFLPSSCLLVNFHGTGGSYNDSFSTSIIREYLGGDCNVISVEYGRYSGLACYPVRGASVPGLGACVARFISLLYSGVPPKPSPDSTHLVGFSFGAQVAASVGHILQALHFPPVAQITGLDPGGPLLEQLPKEQVLDQSDAACVLVLHTSKVLGTVLKSGHTDYYIHGGVTQPGCTSKGAVCNHRKAAEYWSDLVGGRAVLEGQSCRPRSLWALSLLVERITSEPLCPQAPSSPIMSLPLTCQPRCCPSFNATLVSNILPLDVRFNEDEPRYL